MTKYRFLQAGALGALVSAVLLTGLPAAAQDAPRGGGWGNREARDGTWSRGTDAPRAVRSNGGDRATVSARQGSSGGTPRASWSGRTRTEAPAAGAVASNNVRYGSGRGAGYTARAETPAELPAPTRNSSYTAPRSGNYGANTRGNWAAQRQTRDAAAQQQRSSGTWARTEDRRGDSNRGSWGNRSPNAGRAEWRDDRRNYTTGYRDGRRDDNRYGNDYRRWDNRGWRNDNRYDWYRYRAANRSLYSLGRYYAPYRGYSYSRISIGFTLGSPFYANRYWINDPWQYRLPAVYGPYRWVRYYDDALLVDIYTGEVVDVINNFFW